MASILKLDTLQTPSGTGVITSPNTIASPGNVIQVVHNKAVQAPGSPTAWFTTSTTTPQNTGFSVSITPKFATSKLLVEIKGNLNINTPSGSQGAQLWIYRDGVNIHSGGNANTGSFIYNGAGLTDNYSSYSNTSMINANNINTTTFSLWVARWSTTETVRLGGHDGQTTLTVWEIAQ